MKKILPVIFIILMLSGCALNQPMQETNTPAPTSAATLNPNITKPEGKFLDTNPKSLEGIVTKADELAMTISVAGENVILKFSEDAKKARQIFEDNGMKIEPGVFLHVEYEKVNGTFYANKISFVKAN